MTAADEERADDNANGGGVEVTNRRKSSAQVQSYSTGEPAIQLDEFGCGFCFYVTGRVAACISKVNAYQRRFQFYEDNKKKTLLATFDEHAVGSAGRPKGRKLILTKEGGLITDANNVVTKAWKWDPKALHAGTPPIEAVVVQLNESLLFTYQDRSTISVRFAPCPGVSVEFACGERLRRTDTYLEHSHRRTEGPHRGKLVIDQQVPTLKQRQKMIELESIEKRSKQKPRSKDLGNDKLKDVVATLEAKFDAYQGCGVTPAADGNWKDKAHAQTIREVPILPRTGFEVGREPTLFGQPLEANDALDTIKRLKNPDTGQWLGSVEVRYRVASDNPVLRRSACLTNASGRYSQDLAVPGGGGRVRGLPLPVVHGDKLDHFLQHKCMRDELVVVACLRMDEHQSRLMEAVLEHVQAQLAEYAAAPTVSPMAAIGAKCKLVKCDLAESHALADRYRIHAVPTFLMFFDGRLVHVSSLGGMALRVFPATKNAHLSNQMDQLPRVLLVEKRAKQQVAIEKVLRKEAFLWDLAISGEQALTYFTQLPQTRTAKSTGASVVVVGKTGAAQGAVSYGVVMISDELEDYEVRSIDRFVRPKEKGKPSDQLVCVVVSKPLCEVHFASVMCVDCRRALGRRISSESKAQTKSEAPIACPHCGIINVAADAKTAVLSPVLAEAVHVIVYKHVKDATMHRLAELWAANIQRNSNNARMVSSDAAPAASTVSSATRPGAKSSSSSSGLRVSDDTHTGLTVDSFMKEVERQLSAAKRGLFLPDKLVPDMALSTKDAVLVATTATLAQQQGKPTAGGVVVNALRSTSA